MYETQHIQMQDACTHAVACESTVNISWRLIDTMGSQCWNEETNLLNIIFFQFPFQTPATSFSFSSPTIQFHPKPPTYLFALWMLMCMIYAGAGWKTDGLGSSRSVHKQKLASGSKWWLWNFSIIGCKSLGFASKSQWFCRIKAAFASTKRR